MVLNTQRLRGCSLLKEGKSIIIDDTNFSNIHWEYWNNIAKEMNISIEIKYFDTPVDECVDRDKHREKSVGEDVIRSMYKKYVKHNISKIDSRFIIKQDKSLPKCIIVDIDGTLALMTGRNPYDDSLIHTDKVNDYVFDLVCTYKFMYDFQFMESDGEIIKNKIILMSGRMDKCRSQTEKWLNDNIIPYDILYMRKTDDFRQDSIVKKELYEEHIKGKYYVEAVFDDRDQVVKMWRDEGLLCCQVYYGNF